MSRDILLNKIEADPNQPRNHFDESAIAELAQSIAENGLLSPIMVRPFEDRYIIVHGERRYRAALSLGLESIPAIVREAPVDDIPFLALVENLQREDLTPTEEAKAYHALVKAGHKQTEIANRVGKTQSYIAQKLRLLRLPDDIQTALSTGEISEGHARQLLRLEDKESQSRLCQDVIANKRSVKHTRLHVTAELSYTGKSMTVKDLANFQREAEDSNLVELNLRASHKLGSILNACERWWGTMPWLAMWAAKEARLSEVYAVMEVEEDYRQMGGSIRHLLNAPDIPEARWEQFIADSFEGKSTVDAETVYRGLFALADKHGTVKMAK